MPYASNAFGANIPGGISSKAYRPLSLSSRSSRNRSTYFFHPQLQDTQLQIYRLPQFDTGWQKYVDLFRLERDDKDKGPYAVRQQCFRGEYSGRYLVEGIPSLVFVVAFEPE